MKNPLYSNVKRICFTIFLVGLFSSCEPESILVRNNFQENLTLQDQDSVFISKKDLNERAISLKNQRNVLSRYSIWLSHIGASSDAIHLLASQNGISWTNLGHIPGRSNDGPSIAFFKGKLYVAYKGSTTDYLYYTSTIDGSNWSGSIQVPNGIKTNKSPAIIKHDGKLYLIYKGRSSSNVHYSYSYDGNTWYNKGHLGNTRSSGEISTTLFKGKLYEFHRNIGGKVGYTVNSRGTNWGNEMIIGNSLDVRSGVACVAYKDKLHIIYNEGQGRIMHQFSSDGVNWSSAAYIGTQKTANGPSASVLNNRLYITFRGFSSSNIHEAYFDGERWNIVGHVSGNPKTSRRPGLFTSKN